MTRAVVLAALAMVGMVQPARAHVFFLAPSTFRAFPTAWPST